MTLSWRTSLEQNSRPSNRDTFDPGRIPYLGIVPGNAE
jgi:hypothetical protein